MTDKAAGVRFVLRLTMGFTCLWPFLDKLFGLGFATPPGRAWLDGVSPTAGFLQYGAEGPLMSMYQAMAGSAVVDWFFMLGLLGIGLGLILGVMVRIASWGGVVLMVLLYLALIPPENNPVLDEHVIYALVFLSFALNPPDNWWGRNEAVRRYPWLR